MHRSLPEIRLHFSIVFSTSGAPFKGMWEMFSCGIQNPGKSGTLGFGIQNPTIRIGIWNLLFTSWNPVHGIQSPRHGIQNPRVVLDSLTRGNMGIHIHFLKLTTTLIISSVYFFSKSNDKITLFSQSILTFYC